jgi:molybdate transport system substrate-binding protein
MPRVFSTLGLAGVLEALGIEATLQPTALLMQRIRGGETADVAILVAESIDELVAEGTLLPGRTDLARSLVGLAVRAGAPRPDISSVENFVAAMHAAHSLALSRAGASGLFFAGLLERLGIGEMVNAKATVIPSGYTGELVARGEAEIAVQQISELMVVPGLDIVGPLPREIEGVAIFSAAIFSASTSQGQAGVLIARLASPALDPIFVARGLDRPGD